MIVPGIEVIGVSVALLAPVYGLLFQIQRRLGMFRSEIQNLNRRVDENENRLQ